MDFWGLNRGITSVRARALERLCALDSNKPGGDVSRLAAVLAMPQNHGELDSQKVSLHCREYEILVAIAGAIAEAEPSKSAADAAKVLISTLAPRMTQLLDANLEDGPTLRGAHCSPWYDGTHKLVRALSNLGAGPAVFEQYLETVLTLFRTAESDCWQKHIRWAFAVRGFFDGLAHAKCLAPEVAATVLKWLSTNVDETFFANLHARSESSDSAAHECLQENLLALADATSDQKLGRMPKLPLEAICISKVASSSLHEYPGAQELSLSFSRFACANVRLLINSKHNALDPKTRFVELTPTKTKELELLAAFSAKWVGYLELRLQAFPAQNLSASEISHKECILLAVWHHFEVMGVAVQHDLFDAQRAFELLLAVAGNDVGAAAVDSVPRTDPRIDAQLNTIRLAVVCCRQHESRLASLTKTLPSYLGSLAPKSASAAASIFVEGLRDAPQSWLVTALYALANAISLDELNVRKPALSSSMDSALGHYATSVLTGLVRIALSYGDNQVCGLAFTILTQKYGQVSESVDCAVLAAMAELAPGLAERDFEALLLQLARIERSARARNLHGIVEAIQSSRVAIASSVKPEQGCQPGPAYNAMLSHLLTLWTGVGATSDSKVPNSKDLLVAAAGLYRTHDDITSAAAELLVLLAPLAALLPSAQEPPLEIRDWRTVAKFRDAWFNTVIVGLSFDTKWTTEQTAHLAIIARSTPPLVSEDSANKLDSDLELNPVLLRGSSGANIAAQRRVLTFVAKGHTAELLRLPFHKLMFMSAAVLLESFRARAGVASKIPLYFGDPDFKSGQLNHALTALADQCMREYVACVMSRPIHDRVFAQEAVANQLKQLLIMCCHRVDAIRSVALKLASQLVQQVPSAMCHRAALFAMLDLMTLVWESCIDSEEDEYEPRMQFCSPRSGIEIELSDSYDMRRQTLSTLLSAARRWGQQVISLLGDELKSLLTVYLDDIDDPIDELGASFDRVSLGRSFALELGGTIRDASPLKKGNSSQGARSLADGSSGFLSQYLALADYRVRVLTGKHGSEPTDEDAIVEVVAKYEALISVRNPLQQPLDPRQLHRLYIHTAPLLTTTTPVSLRLAKEAVHLPFRSFNVQLVRSGIMFWLWATHTNPELRMPILQAVGAHWSRSVYRKVGLFSRKHDPLPAMSAEMHYAPTDKGKLDQLQQTLTRLYEPHVVLIDFLRASFHATIHLPGAFLDEFARLLTDALYGLEHYASMHPLARTARLEIIRLSLETLGPYARLRPKKAAQLSSSIVKAALAWYKQPLCWPYGGNLVQQRRDVALLRGVIDMVVSLMTASPDRQLLLLLMRDELSRLQVWSEPLGSSGHRPEPITAKNVSDAWLVDPEIAAWLLSRRADRHAHETLTQLISNDPLRVVRIPFALQFFLQSPPSSPRRRFVLYWQQVSPIDSIVLFSPQYGGDSLLLQYAMRSLECHPVETSFFYVPHIVQMLRHDNGGYVEEYILEAAKFSQLFAHQIIWNINANAYKDDDGQVPDDMKPTLDRVLKRIKSGFSDKEREFYETEFGFFDEVTSISGKLKPYIKKSKAEKKAKIDEEMAVINVPEGAYLPSNPDGTVVDIDRESGKPLQSHAKAPFLARFRIKREQNELWQGAIFKVGDDCRQDVLVLQILAVFQSIFNYSGIDCYLYPYKVTATGPGMGVIDVLPNSISRDMLGREAVNGLHEWFISKHGTETSIDMQRARNNFVKSMAAYSVVSYLLQFKDRHNGNIMYDDDGHVIHIDFGFIFDIVPGGVKFEAVPFKLTKEMVAVMGGNAHTQPFKWFEELCVKAFLVARAHAESIIRMVSPMLESGLPCFTPHTISRLRTRFVLNKSEREAAQYMRGLIAKSYESTFTKGYDEFQRITNGIPY